MQTAVDEVLTDPSVNPFLFPAPPSTLLQLSVIVPARNEAHHLTHTLDALRNQQDSAGNPLDPATYEVLLLVNNCTDHSYKVARQYQQTYSDFPLHISEIHLPATKANIGTVRRLLMDEAYRRLTISGSSNGIIASTDGDTVVDKHWVYYIMQEIAKGNDAVGGRILTHPEQSLVRLYHLRNVMYRTLVARAEAILDPSSNDPWPRHFQHFGASIAVTCRVYDQAGRLPEKPYLEDEAFYKALLRMDAKVRQSPHVKVFTSTRTDGRVDIGFSEQLRFWANLDHSGKDQLVEPPAALILKFRNRQKLRAYWHNRSQATGLNDLTPIAQELCIDDQWLKIELKMNPFFGQLWEKVEAKMQQGQWSACWQLVPITTAIQDLRTFLRPYIDA
ncbi:glycosyltransferase [Spirosoma oryzicola]|uniref:glycosyltransferase n=1 Tax=Spirosoma oryzicola TaxID=2898794 RepID=UPI001E558595|nr:glycosyltransferase family 2 protein [Spirosoma oryzicola]UHG92847.1 glycosyltransferase family 2 protein [Spirosoma oryzicola]